MTNNVGPKEKVAGPLENSAADPPKAKFKVNEKVLCYEPDNKKAQVLYDSKVLEAVQHVDHLGIHYSYKIHFQGWKDTWDRYVAEDQVLKSTSENKELQQCLYDEVAAAKALKNKKKKATIKEKLLAVQASTKGLKTIGKGNLKVKSVKEKWKGKAMGMKGAARAKQDLDNSNTDQDSSDDERFKESENIVIPYDAKISLEWDYHNVKNKNLIVKLPSSVPVITIFEAYIRNIAKDAIKSYAKKYHSKPDPSTDPETVTNATGKHKTSKNPRPTNDIVNEELMKVIEKITFTTRVMEDLRIMFDFLLPQILLFSNEWEQYEQYLRGDFNRMPFDKKLKKAEQADLGDIKVLNIVKSAMPPPSPPPQKSHKASELSALYPTLLVNSLEPKTKPLKKYPPSPKSAAGKEAASNSAQSCSSTSSDLSKSAAEELDNLITLKMISLNKIKTEPVDVEVEDDIEPPKKRLKTGKKDNHKRKRKRCKIAKFGCDSDVECEFPWACEYLNRFMDDLYNFKLLPPEELNGVDPHPCVCYGTQHLLRLFVSMPGVLSRTTIPRRKLGSIVNEINNFVIYLTFLKGEVLGGLYYPGPEVQSPSNSIQNLSVTSAPETRGRTRNKTGEGVVPMVPVSTVKQRKKQQESSTVKQYGAFESSSILSRAAKARKSFTPKSPYTRRFHSPAEAAASTSRAANQDPAMITSSTNDFMKAYSLRTRTSYK